ncbi:MAG: Mth938-like domain-containing protein [Pseudomonadota bacterium]
MKMSELGYEGVQPPVDGYAPGGFRIGGRFAEGAVLLSPRGLARLETAELETLPLAHLTALAPEVDVLLVGTGPDIRTLPAPLADALTAAGIGVEAMSSPSACRTYNVLLSEGRRVAAAILPV